jgi:hypothetical protein
MGRFRVLRSLRSPGYRKLGKVAVAIDSAFQSRFFICRQSHHDSSAYLTLQVHGTYTGISTSPYSPRQSTFRKSAPENDGKIALKNRVQNEVQNAEKSLKQRLLGGSPRNAWAPK